MFYHYAKFQSLKSLYHIKCTIERKFFLKKHFISSQLIRKLAIHKAWCGNPLWTIAKFSGFSGYSKGWLLQIMEPLINYTHYCSSDSYHNSKVFRFFWLLERLVTTKWNLWLITRYCSSDSYCTLEKPILLSKWHTRNSLHFLLTFECP